MSRTYYDILGLKASATADEIKRAYRQKALTAHPDVNKAPGAAAAFQEISEAYSILSDQSKRVIYNQKLRDSAAMDAGRAYARSRGRSQPNTTSTRSGPVPPTGMPQDEAFHRWVMQARAKAEAQAKMKYKDFKASRFEQTEASMFYYLQFVVLAALLVIACSMFALPFLLMFFVNWKAVFLGLVMIPFAMKMMTEAKRQFLQLKATTS